MISKIKGIGFKLIKNGNISEPEKSEILALVRSLGYYPQSYEQYAHEYRFMAIFKEGKIISFLDFLPGTKKGELPILTQIWANKNPESLNARRAFKESFGGASPADFLFQYFVRQRRSNGGKFQLSATNADGKRFFSTHQKSGLIKMVDDQIFSRPINGRPSTRRR